MAKTTLFYLLLLTGLFFSFTYILDDDKVKADSLADKVSYDALHYQWVVAEAKDRRSDEDLTEEYQTVLYHFLSSGALVGYDDKIIKHTGTWKTVDDRFAIEIEGTSAEVASFEAKLIRSEELLLLNEHLQLRLLRLQP